MAHEIDMSNGRANMAYTGERPWHGLGSTISPDASIDEWRKAAGLDWQVRSGALFRQNGHGEFVNVTDALSRRVLYRSDTGAPLSVVGSTYQIVQPGEILEFIGDAVDVMGWKMSTAGSLHGGRKIWALADLDKEHELPGGDRVTGHLLAATSCDGSMASEFMFTTIRVVCQNTLHMAQNNGAPSTVRVNHMSKMRPDDVKARLGIAGTSWATFIENAKRLTEIRLTDADATSVLRKVFPMPKGQQAKLVEGERITDEAYLAATPTARKVLELFDGRGIGMQMPSAFGTAWGLVNATTQYFDHERNTRSDDGRLNSAWFGSGADRKQEVVDACLAL